MPDAFALSVVYFGDRSVLLADLPPLLGPPVTTGEYRASVDDFVVQEDLGFVPEGDGSHAWLWVEKVGVSTDEAANRLALRFGVSRKDMGYAGKKDTFARTMQWFSMPMSTAIVAGPIDAAVTVLKVSANARKLKIGQLAGNWFELRLHIADASSVDARLARMQTEGIANYFGPQRFGKHGQNLSQARRLAARDPEGRRRLHPKEGMAASAARSAAFNAIVAQRIALGHPLQVEVGETVIFTGRGSQFLVDASDLPDVARRVAEGELSPTAPMPGRMSQTGAKQRAFEDRIIATDVLAAWMHGVFPSEERRAIRVIPKELVWQHIGTTLELRFWLPRGSFATAVLHELGLFSESHARITS